MQESERKKVRVDNEVQIYGKDGVQEKEVNDGCYGNIDCDRERKADTIQRKAKECFLGATRSRLRSELFVDR